MSRGFQARAVVLLAALLGTAAWAHSSRGRPEIRSLRCAAAATTGRLPASAPRENNSAGKPDSRLQPAHPAAPAGTQAIVAPKRGFTIVAEGRVRRLTCKGEKLEFLLMVNGSGVLHFFFRRIQGALCGVSGLGGTPFPLLLPARTARQRPFPARPREAVFRENPGSGPASLRAGRLARADGCRALADHRRRKAGLRKRQGS